MCELFGFTSSKEEDVTDYLKAFYSHCEEHPHGWGLSILDENRSCLVKEPVKASKSDLLKEMLSSGILGKNILAHIRFATIGKMDKTNCHPFAKKDKFGRTWTLIHNGTIFNCPELSKYHDVECGDTDSERIICCFVDKINGFEKELSAEERFNFINDMVSRMAEGNKLNFMLSDGEQIFVHINCQGLLHYLKDEHSIIFSTKPLDDNLFWFNFPLNTLISFKDGKVLFKGESHGKEYIPTCEQLWAVSDFILSMQDDNSEGELNFDRSDLKSLKYRFI
jgi:predicted glutamine amidotransferase